MEAPGSSRPRGGAPPPAAAARDPGEHPLLAIGLVTLAMLLFVSTDGAAKVLAASMSPLQIIWVRYAVIVVILLPILAWRHAEKLLRTTRPVLHVLRGLLLAVSGTIFVFSLERLPLELSTAIGFAAPLYVTALSIPLLGEQVGARRWAAVGVGFAGVLVILRPGGAGFQWAMVLPLVSSFCWAVGLIITRMMRGTEHPMTILAWSSLVGCVAAAPFALPAWRAPGAFEWLLLVGIGVLNAGGQYLVIRAFMIAHASLLAPFSYSTIVWATLIGAFVFGTFPDAQSIAGTLVLVAAGLYVWHRERVRHTPATVPGASLGEAAEALAEDSPAPPGEPARDA